MTERSARTDVADTRVTAGAGDPGSPDAAVGALVDAFRTVHTDRMRGLPFVNDALRVEAVGFAPWREHWLGVLITPWFVNLVLLPRERERWLGVRLGEARSYAFPAGVYEFIGGFDERVGEFQSCSLFSPVFEFADQASARMTARCALDALFDEANREAPAFDVSPDVPATVQAPDAQSDSGAPAPRDAQRPPAPVQMSRRTMLRGEFPDAGRRDRG